MNRRGFLQAFGLGAIGLAVGAVLPDDPERKLWVPGAKSYFMVGSADYLDADGETVWEDPDQFGMRDDDEYGQVYNRALERYSGNRLLTADIITREALKVLENKLAFCHQVNRQYDSQFTVSGAKIAPILNIRKPLRYNAASHLFDRES